ncbi:MAG TPA: Na+/H+ antiporter [Candidatus Limnocylindrales bacterium]
MTIHIGPIEIIFLVLVVATALSYLARRIRIAEPILFLLGGVVLGFVPGLPAVELEPDLVFLLFLPPILFAAAYFTPIRDFKANARPILLLAIGLVLFTTAVVGVVAASIVPGMSLAVALTLGAIVAPPDAVAATAVMQRLGVPRRVVTILEGESLVNDASALIAYRTAIAVALTGTFSALDAGVGFVVSGVGGILVGLLVGAIVTRALYKTGEPTLEIVVSLIAPMAGYLAAEAVGVSGVLATVVAGLMTGRRAATVFSPDARLMGRGVWQIVIWAINAFVFMLIGLQLPSIVAGLSDYGTAELLWFGIAISLTVIVTRIVWVFPATYLPRLLSRRLRERDPYPPPRAVFVVAWAGMRGVVSLAAALALQADFPQRELILFLTFCVIVATLVGQGLSLPWIVRRLGLVARDGPDTEESIARRAAVEAAQLRLDELALEFPDHLPLIDQLRTQYEHEAAYVWPDADGPQDEAEQELLDHRAIRDALVGAEREAVIRLRDDGIINDETLRRVERDLDLEALRSSG